MDTTLHVKSLSLTVVLHKTSDLNSCSYEHDLCSWQRKQAMLAGCQENVRPPAESLRLCAVISKSLFLKNTQGFNKHFWEQMKVVSAKELSG